MLDRILDQILIDVDGAYHHEHARFRALELSLFRPFQDYDPVPFLERLKHLEHHVGMFRQIYHNEPKGIEQYRRLFAMMPAFETEYMAAYRKVSEVIGFERFLNNLQWSRAFAKSLATIYGLSDSSSDATCRGILDSRPFRVEKAHLRESDLGVVMREVYGTYVQRHMQDLQRLFATLTGQATAQAFLQHISTLEKQLQSSATALQTTHKAGKLTFDRRSHYLDCVRALMSWHEENLSLSDEDLAEKRAARLFTVVDVQAHATYQHKERDVLQAVLNALQKKFEDGYENFNDYVAGIRLGLHEVVQFRDKMRRTAERLNQSLQNYLPEKYLMYLVEAEDQYRKSVFFHFHVPVDARAHYPASIYGQFRVDQLIGMVPEFKAQFEREQVYGAIQNQSRMGSYLDRELEKDDDGEDPGMAARSKQDGPYGYLDDDDGY